MDTIGWSDFASNRHKYGAGYSYFTGNDEELFQLIRDNWDKRVAGHGTDSVDKVSLIPVPADNFVCNTVPIENVTPENLSVEVTSRREGEEKHVKVTSSGPCELAKFVNIVLYSKEELEASGEERSGDYDWEIVCIIASAVEDEPMTPLAMARNQLDKEGGSKREYASEQWAEAGWYWSQRVVGQ